MPWAACYISAVMTAKPQRPPTYWHSTEFATRVFTIILGWLFGFALSELDALAPHKSLVFYSFAVVWTAAGLYGLWHEYRRFSAA